MYAAKCVGLASHSGTIFHKRIVADSVFLKERNNILFSSSLDPAQVDGDNAEEKSDFITKKAGLS